MIALIMNIIIPFLFRASTASNQTYAQRERKENKPLKDVVAVLKSLEEEAPDPDWDRLPTRPPKK